MKKTLLSKRRSKLPRAGLFPYGRCCIACLAFTLLSVGNSTAGQRGAKITSGSTAGAVNDAVQRQKIKISGQVLDEQKNPLAGAAVVIAGSTGSVSTDLDGKFTIEVSPGQKLNVSFIGYETQTIDPQGRTELIIHMQVLVNELENVTVVAFAKQKKESVVASVTTIRPSDLKVPSSNLTTALAGRISGVISYQRSGEPGQDNADFFVRGVTTFGTGKRDPLILIDGVELGTADLARLNTDDIASFSVMKDANATALYGARGANGVILVTTKEGVEGKTKISLRIQNSFSMPTSNIALADGVTYMNLQNEAIKTRDPDEPYMYSPEKIANTVRGANPNVYPNVDWKKYMFKRVTHNYGANINLSGGSKNARYYVAGSFSQDNGSLKVDKRNNFNSNIDLKKYTLRTNVNINVTKTTELGFRISGAFDDYTGPIEGGAALYKLVMRANPVLFPPFYTPDKANEQTKHILFGKAEGNHINPYAHLVYGYKDYSKAQIIAQFNLNQKLDFITKGLSARAMFNTSRYSYFDVTRSYSPFYYALAGYDEATGEHTLMPLNADSGRDYLDYKEGRKQVESSLYMEAVLQYSREFNKKHSVGALLVFTTRERLEGNAGSIQKSLPFRNVGLAGRITYGYDNRYFIEGNFGYNGSERFARKERYGFFPSVGAGYMMSNEEFWKPLRKTISKLKFKATYGMVGNDQIGSSNDRFFYLSEIDMTSGGYTFGSNFDYKKSGVAIKRYGNDMITWETSYKQNYGIELGLFDVLELQVDYFRELRKDILQKRADISSTMGLQSSVSANLGESFSSGVDISLDYNQVFNSDTWISVRGNFTYASSEYRKFEEPIYKDSPWRQKIGQSLGQRYGLIAERLFLDDEDVKNSPVQTFGEYTAGDIKYKDINMDGQIDDRDFVPIGFPTTPEIIYGAGFSFGFKNFDISAFFQGSARSSFWINVREADDDDIGPFVGDKALLQVIADNHWSEDRRNPHAFWPRLSNRDIANNSQTSTWWMRNGAFLRLKSAELGYTLPKKISRQIHMETARIYVSGTNLFRMSGFKLWDPEMASNGLGYPVQRVFNIGLNITF